jgi:hypothetical protein
MAIQKRKDTVGTCGDRQRIGKMLVRLTRKALLVSSIVFLGSCGAMSQSPYLLMRHGDLSALLRFQGLDVMETDSSHIHCVDDRKLRNVILFFSDGVCKRVMTTFQNHYDYQKVMNFLDVRYGDLEGTTWIIPMANGYDMIRGVSRRGYDIIDENFTTDAESVE